MNRNGDWSSRAQSDGRQQVRAEIGRQLREHYDASLGPLPDRLAYLLAKIEHTDRLCEVLANEQARRV